MEKSKIRYEKGDAIAGEKIIMEAGKKDIKDNVPLLASGHRGVQIIGKKTAFAIIDQPTRAIVGNEL